MYLIIYSLSTLTAQIKQLWSILRLVSGFLVQCSLSIVFLPWLLIFRVELLFLRWETPGSSMAQGPKEESRWRHSRLASGYVWISGDWFVAFDSCLSYDSWWEYVPLNIIELQKDNVANQREHLILLLANVHIRQFPKPDQQPRVLYSGLALAHNIFILYKDAWLLITYTPFLSSWTTVHLQKLWRNCSRTTKDGASTWVAKVVFVEWICFFFEILLSYSQWNHYVLSYEWCVYPSQSTYLLFLSS